MLSVVVLAYGPAGNPYAQFVQRWWEAVRLIQPAEVVVVHSDPEPLGVLAAAPPEITVKAVPMRGSFANGLNIGTMAASQPWVSTIGIDDCYRPGACELLPLADAVGAEIMLWNHYELGGHVWTTSWDVQTLRRANTVQGSSPFRRDLWVRAGGFPDIGWSDWGFWLRCAKAGAKAWHCGRIGVDFDPGLSHATYSGRALSEQDRDARDKEVFALVSELGL